MKRQPHHRKRYLVNLTDEERTKLIELTRKGQSSSRIIKRANILLLAEQGKIDKEIASLLHCGASTVERTRKRFVITGTIEGALYEKKRPGSKTKLDTKAEAILATLSESKPPPGRKRWTLRLMADRLVELEVVDTISHEAVRRSLKKAK